VVTSLPAGAIEARTLYEDVYCARGEVENRIKEQQLDVFADRNLGRDDAPTSSGSGSLPRLRPARCAAPDRTAAHSVCGRHLRHDPAQALKFGAQVRVSVRRIKVAMLAAPRRPPRSSLGARQAACPHQAEYHLASLRRAAFAAEPLAPIAVKSKRDPVRVFDIHPAAEAPVAEARTA
jgi:Transposase DDE domain group 1